MSLTSHAKYRFDSLNLSLIHGGVEIYYAGGWTISHDGVQTRVDNAADMDAVLRKIVKDNIRTTNFRGDLGALFRQVLFALGIEREPNLERTVIWSTPDGAMFFRKAPDGSFVKFFCKAEDEALPAIFFCEPFYYADAIYDCLESSFYNWVSENYGVHRPSETSFKNGLAFFKQ